LVNDGSTDDSLNIVENTYKNEILKSVIKIINQPNQGVSAARNNGVNSSNAELVCFLDADDEWLPDFLMKILALINDFPEANLYSLAHFVSKGQGLKKPNQGLPDNFRGYVLDFFRASFRGSVVNSSKVCVRKNALLNIGAFPLGVVAGEDLYVWILLALKGRVACDINYSVIIHQEFDDSRSAREISVPYPFLFFSRNKDIKRGISLNMYLFSIFIKHFISSFASLKFKEAFHRVYYFIRMFL